MKERPVEFYCWGEKIVGTVYLPDDYTEGKKLPCVIPCSGFTGVNAMYPALIARLLTKYGYGCLGFDYRGWAPSEGRVGVTTFNGEYDDITAAYIFAQQQPEFDPDNISLFGWGLAGPITIKVAVDNPAIKCVCVGNTFANGERMTRMNLSVKEYQEHQARAAADRIKRVLTGDGEYVDGYSFSNPYNETTENMKTAFLNDAVPELFDTAEANLEKKDYEKGKFPPDHSWLFYDDTMRINAEKYVADLAPRGLLIVGSLDDVVYNYYESECLYKAAGEGASLLAIHGDHNNWMLDDHPEFKRFGQHLVQFYDSNMK